MLNLYSLYFNLNISLTFYNLIAFSYFNYGQTLAKRTKPGPSFQL